jgi:hypothetical protein
LEISRCSRGVKLLAPPRGKFSSVEAAMVTAEALFSLVFLLAIVDSRNNSESFTNRTSKKVEVNKKKIWNKCTE